jgi:hypothetical protein
MTQNALKYPKTPASTLIEDVYGVPAHWNEGIVDTIVQLFCSLTNRFRGTLDRAQKNFLCEGGTHHA